MRRAARVGGVVGLIAAGLGVWFLVVRPADGPSTSLSAASISVGHGPEPIIRSVPGGGTWTANANFWASAADVPAERLTYGVSVANAREIGEAPVVRSDSEVRDGKRWVSVSLDFAYGAIRDHASIDLTVTFADASGRSGSATMTIDEN